MESLLQRITIDHDICQGKPTIRGLRYPVENMLELLASGMTIDELLFDYPDLEKDDFLACLEYAAKLTQIKSIYKIASWNSLLMSNLIEINRTEIIEQGQKELL